MPVTSKKKPTKKPAKKKAVAKKKPATKKPAKKAKAPEKGSKADKLALFCKDLNKKMKGVGRIDIGRDVSWIDPPRISSGILGLDIVSRGGMPRGCMISFWGPFSSAKTTTAIHCMASAQRRGEDTLFAAAEGFNKDWARKNGLWIPYGDEEYLAVNEQGYTDEEAHDINRDMQEYDCLGDVEGYGSVTVLQHVHGDGLLEAAYRAVKTNLFAYVVVDSLSVLKNARQIDDAEVGDEEMGGGGQITMFNRFTSKCFSALNTKYDEAGNIDMDGGTGNGTILICMSQARIKMGARRGMGGQPMQPTGGEGLKHAWHLSVEFQKGEDLGEHASVDGKQRWKPYGIEVRVRVVKSKIGPHGRSARWHLYTEENPKLTVGEVDRGQQARVWGIYYNVIEQTGAWYTMPDGERVNGKDKVDEYLATHVDVLESIEAEILKRCKR